MRFEFDDVQSELRQVVGAFLDGLAPLESLLQNKPGTADRDWRDAAELGLLGVNAPEEKGGLQGGPVTLVGLLEVMGQKGWSGPYLSTVAIGLDALSLVQEDRWIEAIVAGELQASLGFLESSGRPELESLGCKVQGGELFGSKDFVLHGETAGLFVVVAREEAGTLGLFALEAGAPGLKVSSAPTMDPGRPLAQLHLEATPCHRLGGAEHVEALLNRASLYAAAESLGGAQATLDMAVEYAKDRQQFGRPIGSFQAIQHHCAEMLLRVESARSAVYAAAWTAEHRPDDFAMVTAMAQATASEAFFFCAGTCIQVLGGIGITWEHPAHLYFKRAQGSRLLWGDPSFQRSRFVAHGGLERPLVESGSWT